MTDIKMALLELVEQEADADLVRVMLTFAAKRIVDLENEAKTGAPAGTHSPDRLNHRNGYRDRNWDTRAGDRAGVLQVVRRRSQPAGGSPRIKLEPQNGVDDVPVLAAAWVHADKTGGEVQARAVAAGHRRDFGGGPFGTGQASA